MKKKLFLSFILGGVLLWWAFRGVSFDEVIEEISKVKWLYLIPAFLLGIISFFFRALRWRFILKEIKPVKFKTLFSINAVGFLFIHLFPFRLGEVVKPYLLKKNEGVRFSSGLATVAIERVFDGIALVLFLVFSFIFANFKTETLPYVNLSINYLIGGGVLIFGSAFVFLILLVFSEKTAVKIVSKIAKMLPEKLGEKIIRITKTFVLGLSALPSLSKNALILFYSILQWFCAVGIMYLGLIAFGLELPWEASFAVLGIVSLGIMLPAPPGFVGNFQLFCQAGLGLYGVSAATGLSFSLVVHFVNICVVFSLGFLCLPSNMVSLKKVMKESKEAGDTEPQAESINL